MKIMRTCEERIINLSLIEEFHTVEVRHNPNLNDAQSCEDSFVCTGILVFINGKEIYLGFFEYIYDAFKELRAVLGHTFIDWADEDLVSFIDKKIEGTIDKKNKEFDEWYPLLEKKREEFHQDLHYEQMNWGIG